MVELGDLGGMGMSLLTTWGFWAILAGFVFAVSFGSLYLRKKAKYHFPAIIISSIGNGKVGLSFTRVGWFKSKKILGGLIEMGGEKRLEVKDGRIVQQGSGSDFHEIKYKAGMILQEKEDDPKILFPIRACELSPQSFKMIMQVAPADYRDACSKIISDSEKEITSKWETIAQVLVFGFVGVVLFISIVLTIQYSKNMMTEANAIHKEALGFYERTLQTISVKPATSP